MNSVCAQIHAMASEMERHRFPFDPTQLPTNGVYLLFEEGEFAHDGDRIVRVGSHTGPNNLAKRLKEHFLVENKDRSIFRKNIGRALLNRENDAFLEQWQWDLTSHANRDKYESRIDRQKLRFTEQKVSEYITCNFSFVILPCSHAKDERLALESRLIATVAQCPSCGPSSNWLGGFSPNETHHRTGLWQVQHVGGNPLRTLDRTNGGELAIPSR